MWTDPTLFAQWWGPKDFANETSEIDMRRGIWRTVMRSPKGVDLPLKGVYREVIQPERIVVACDLSEHPADWPDLLQQDRGVESRSRKSAQDDKWSFCLRAGTLCPANQERQ